MNRLSLVFMVACLCMVFTSCKDDVIQTQTVNLQIDSYQEGGSSTFVATTLIGEEVAVSLGPVNSTYQITHIDLRFGGTGNNPVMRDVILKIYRESGNNSPGTMLYSGNQTLTASNNVIRQIDISNDNVMVDGGGSIRVSFELTDAIGFPSFAQEFDGTYFESKNWIKDPDGTWHSNDGIGVNGNWVIRATVEEEI